MSTSNPTFNDELIISNDHIQHLQLFTSTVSEINRILGYNITHNNSYRERAAVALDQHIYPELGIIHNPKVTGADAFDKFGRSREYKKVELGPGYNNPCQRVYNINGSINQRSKGKRGFQPNKITFMLSRFRNAHTQQMFINNDTLTISLFFAENAMPSVSYVIKSRSNLEKIVVFFNEQLHNAPHGTNKWSHNNVSIPIEWIVTQLDPSCIDVIVMIDNKHHKISVQDHNDNFIGKDLTLSGFLL